MESRIKISLKLWLKLISDLKKRGQNSRESGAFLLASKHSKKIKKYLCFDDLDPTCLTGMIEFHNSGYQKLWSILENEELVVIADVHTHPSSWTGQSGYDKKNPMISMPRHIAIIIPYYAMRLFPLKKGIGVYEYLGNYSWKNLNSNSIEITLL